MAGTGQDREGLACLHGLPVVVTACYSLPQHNMALTVKQAVSVLQPQHVGPRGPGLNACNTWQSIGACQPSATAAHCALVHLQLGADE